MKSVGILSKILFVRVLPFVCLRFINIVTQIKKIKTLVSPEGAIRSEWEKVRDLRAKEKYK